MFSFSSVSAHLICTPNISMDTNELILLIVISLKLVQKNLLNGVLHKIEKKHAKTFSSKKKKHAKTQFVNNSNKSNFFWSLPVLLYQCLVSSHVSYISKGYSIGTSKIIIQKSSSKKKKNIEKIV